MSIWVSNRITSTCVKHGDLWKGFSPFVVWNSIHQQNNSVDKCFGRGCETDHGDKRHLFGTSPKWNLSDTSSKHFISFSTHWAWIQLPKSRDLKENKPQGWKLSKKHWIGWHNSVPSSVTKQMCDPGEVTQPLWPQFSHRRISRGFYWWCLKTFLCCTFWILCAPL